MKAKLLIAVLFGTFATNAQTTHMVDWFMGVTGAETNITIDEGDTVTWTWQDNMPHSVTSVSGPETFDSGFKTGMGQTFSHEFTEVGVTAYQCDAHPMMNGMITVEATMGVEEASIISFKYFPNPVTDVLTLTAAENIDSVEVYDVNGRMLMSSATPNSTVKIYMEKLLAGTYLIKATIGSNSKNITVLKQ